MLGRRSLSTPAPLKRSFSDRQLKCFREFSRLARRRPCAPRSRSCIRDWLGRGNTRCFLFPQHSGFHPGATIGEVKMKVPFPYSWMAEHFPCQQASGPQHLIAGAIRTFHYRPILESGARLLVWHANGSHLLGCQEAKPAEPVGSNRYQVPGCHISARIRCYEAMDRGESAAGE